MNREVLYRAKIIKTGEWIEGSLLQTTAVSLKSFIVPSACYTFDKWDWAEWLHVDTDTICQWTGLLDRNGNKIWENDILKTWSDEYAQVKFGLYSTVFASDDCNQGFYVEFPEDAIYRHELGYWCKESYVIGNIFDNKELLQEEHK